MGTPQRFSLGWRRGPSRGERWALELIPQTTPDVTKQRSLAQYVATLFDQGAAGSCTANAGCLSAMIAAAVEGTPTPVLSRLWMYYYERQIIGTFPQDSGADVIDEYDVDSQDGNVADSLWPYDASKITETPPAAASSAQKYKTVAAYQPISASNFRDGILTALDNNQPVTIGLNWFEGWMTSWSQSGILAAASMDYVAGGHAVTIIGWVPPGVHFAQGAYLFQNSWGATSPNNTGIHSDATSGRGFIPAEVFAMSSVGGEADAVVGIASPATLSVTITSPASATIGQPSAWSAAVTGLPAGSIAVYTWTFPTATLTGQNVSYTPTAAGLMNVSCRVSVQSTGAGASATASITVQPAPTPTPVIVTQAAVDAVFAQVETALTAMLPQYQADQGATDQINYGVAVLQYTQKQGVDPLYLNSKAQFVGALPKPQEAQ